jgi:hypothetical protein
MWHGNGESNIETDLFPLNQERGIKHSMHARSILLLCVEGDANWHKAHMFALLMLE